MYSSHRTFVGHQCGVAIETPTGSCGFLLYIHPQIMASIRRHSNLIIISLQLEIIAQAMKRARDDSDDFLVWWHTRDGKMTSMYPKSFLAKYSGFFAGFFRNSQENYVEVKLPYPKDIIKALFKHLDGETLNITTREETMLEECLSFLCMEAPYDKIENEGFEQFYCAWCSNTCDGSICTAKRWFLLNGRQICAICCESIQYCDCEHRNRHCSDLKWVREFQNMEN